MKQARALQLWGHAAGSSPEDPEVVTGCEEEPPPAGVEAALLRPVGLPGGAPVAVARAPEVVAGAAT